LCLQGQLGKLKVVHLVFAFRSGSNNVQDAALEILAVLVFHGLLRRISIAELDVSEAFAVASLAIL
jgi:hypothetical protein